MITILAKVVVGLKEISASQANAQAQQKAYHRHDSESDRVVNVVVRLVKEKDEPFHAVRSISYQGKQILRYL